MARQQKHLKKKEIKEDPVMRGIAQSQVWLAEHRKKLFIGGGIVAVILIAAVLISNQRETAFVESRRALQEVQSQLSEAGQEDWVSPLLQVADQYQGTSGGMEALYTAAEIALSQDDNEQAIQLYERFLDEYDGEYMLDTGARAGLATAYENLGRFEEAAQLYDRIAHDKDARHDRYYALLNEGRAWYMAGNYNEARNTFQTILDEKETGDFRVRAEEELARIEVTVDSVGLP